MSEGKNVFDSSNLVVYVYRWRKPLIAVTLAAAVLAAIFSAPFFITPKYESEAVLFPTTTNSVSQALLSENLGSDKDIMEFGKEEEAEQMLQVLNSDEIRRRVIEKFKLLSHYEIDPNSKFKQTELFRQYSSNISFKRTQYMSVVIRVLDKDPQMAADIANYITAHYDTVSGRIKKERAKEALSIVEDQYEHLQTEIQKMEDSLKSLRKLGVHDYEAQSAILNEQLALAKIERQTAVAKELQEQLDLLAEYGGVYTNLRDQLVYLKAENSTLRKKYVEAKVNLERSLPYKFVVSEAFASEKKAYPTRWLIVAVAMVGAFLFTLIVILVVDTLKTVKVE